MRWELHKNVSFVNWCWHICRLAPLWPSARVQTCMLANTSVHRGAQFQVPTGLALWYPDARCFGSGIRTNLNSNPKQVRPFWDNALTKHHSSDVAVRPLQFTDPVIKHAPFMILDVELPCLSTKGYPEEWQKMGGMAQTFAAQESCGKWQLHLRRNWSHPWWQERGNEIIPLDEPNNKLLALLGTMKNNWTQTGTVWVWLVLHKATKIFKLRKKSLITIQCTNVATEKTHLQILAYMPFPAQKKNNQPRLVSHR